MKTDFQACPSMSADPLQPSEVVPDVPALGFVALSKFVVANGMTASVKASFRNRPHLVDGAPGYLRMDVVSPVDRPDEIWLMTFWTDDASFHAWHHSHLYHASHKGIPGGLKLVPGETQIRGFEHVAS
jgi:heme-degrading monooxygenase HmoA